MSYLVYGQVFFPFSFPSHWGVISKKKESAPVGTDSFFLRVDPYCKGLDTQESKQEVANFVCTCKNGRKTWEECPFMQISDLGFMVHQLRKPISGRRVADNLSYMLSSYCSLSIIEMLKGQINPISSIYYRK